MADKMNIVIQSTLSGKAAGFHTVSIGAKDKVDDLISAYCIAKGIPQRSHYILRTSKNVPLESTRSVESYKVIEDGETLFLGSKADEDSMFGFNNWLVLGFLSLLIGGVGMVSVILVYCLDVPADPVNYSVVMDAGSTHTMAYLFEWKSDKINGTGIVKQVDSCRAKHPGISSFKSDPQNAGSSLTTCIDTVKKEIVQDDRKSTTLYLAATAGMRILNATDQVTTLKILDSVKDTLRMSGLVFKSAKIISGEAEGEYAWITLNFLNKNFETIKPQQAHHTVGALDLGGASTQIAYEVSGKSPINTTLFGKTYSLYSNTFLCFGMTQIYLRHLASLVKDPTIITNYEDPCTPKGRSKTLSGEDLYGNVCTRSVSVQKHLNVATSRNYTFSGTSNPTECRKLVAGLFNTAECTKEYPSNVCFKNISDFQHSKFLAISGFYSVIDFLNATNVTLSKYEYKINDFCGKTWDQLKIYLPDRYLDKSCFDGLYIHQLLVNGYGFTAQYWPNIKFLQEINGNDLGWALGYMITKTNDLVGQLRAAPPISLLVLCILVALFGIFILLAVAFGCHAIKQRKYKWSYQSVRLILRRGSPSSPGTPFQRF